MKALLVYPRHADAFWTYKHARRFFGKKGISSPVGLLIVGALLPADWEKRFIDLNVTPLSEADLAWADMVLVGAMLAQQASALQVIAGARRLGKKIIAGGPLFCPELIEQGLFAGVDHIVVGEAEDLLPELLADLAAGRARAVYRQTGYPAIERVPVPMWSLLNLRDYGGVVLQFSRGCPFGCDFCYGHEINGRTVRVKSAAQIRAELDALLAAGWRGLVFVCDDNLVGNRQVAITHLLPHLTAWMQAHGYPFTFTGAASVNLANEPEVMDGLVAAGFESLTLGIESPHGDSLAEVHKRQNLQLDMLNAVQIIQAHGLEVQAGMILGFDHDPPDIFERQVDFIQRSGISNALVSLLYAFPDTALYNRLKAEQRLSAYQIGDCVHGAINFVPRMPLETLTAGYKQVLQSLYAPDAYYARLEVFLRQYRPVRRKLSLPNLPVDAVLQILFRIGVADRWRTHFWALLIRALRQGPDMGMAYLRQAVAGYFLRQDIAEYAPAPQLGLE